MSASNAEFLSHMNLETGRLTWAEAERHFARGVVVKVAAELDLVKVAAAMPWTTRLPSPTGSGGRASGPRRHRRRHPLALNTSRILGRGRRALGVLVQEMGARQ